MPDFMHAADVIVTKAGPGTISEAFNSGLPMVLYSRLPGQEEGNVNYVTANGAGVWAPQPDQIVATLRLWIEKPSERQKAAQASQSLAHPEAARKIAQILMVELGLA
jgi:1,2-diacylglycerol 3-beta-galactosyltransferase